MKGINQFICLVLMLTAFLIPLDAAAETSGNEHGITTEQGNDVGVSNASGGKETTESATDPQDVTEKPEEPEVQEEKAQEPEPEPEPEPKEPALPVTGFITVYTASTPLYQDIKGVKKEAGSIKKGEEFAYISYDDRYFAIEVGGKKSFISITDVKVSDGKKIKNKTTNKKKVKTIEIKHRNVSVYANNKATASIGTLYKGFSYSAYQETANGYYINFGTQSAFIKKKDIAPAFSSKDQYFITLEQTPIYILSGNKYVQKGKIPAGTTLNRTGTAASGKYHKIKYGAGAAYILASPTIPAVKFTVNTEKNTDVYMTAKTAWVYTKANTTSAKLASVVKGEKFPIIKREKGWYVILIGGKKGYVRPADATPVYKDLVNSKVTYTYAQMGVDIKELAIMYDGLVSTQVIGKSVDGRNLYAVKLGKGKKEIFLNGSHHAREHMTTNVLMEMIDSYAYSYVKGTKIKNYNTRSILNNVSIWFVPMVNPDGVTLVQKGHTSAKNPQAVLKLNGGKKNFKAWKANIRGVDLNRQYPANWSKIKKTKPGYKNFKGNKPLSEPEVVHLVNFVRKHKFKSATAYHSSGEVLYWHYHQTGARYTRDKQIARKYSKLTGYGLMGETKKGQGGGGFKDWFVEETKMTGFTPEIAPYVGEKPVPNSYFPSVWKKNQAAGLMLAHDAMNR
ncbi:MAG: M14 family zinc carboxypeptidase [Bacillus sp. (in: firmicutes)]